MHHALNFDPLGLCLLQQTPGAILPLLLPCFGLSLLQNSIESCLCHENNTEEHPNPLNYML